MNGELERLVSAYALNKTELESYKELCDKENSEIKRLMEEEKITEYTTSDYITVKYVVQKKETMNEQKLLEIAHNYGLNGIIETREYINFDALENAIYNGLLPQEAVVDMSKARECKEIATVRISRKKR